MTKQELIVEIARLSRIQRETRKRYREREWGKKMPKPGTKEFGQRAQARKEALQRGGKNDLRVQTAYKTAKKATAAKNKIISGD